MRFSICTRSIYGVISLLKYTCTRSIFLKMAVLFARLGLRRKNIIGSVVQLSISYSQFLLETQKNSFQGCVDFLENGNLRGLGKSVHKYRYGIRSTSGRAEEEFLIAYLCLHSQTRAFERMLRYSKERGSFPGG